MGLSDVLLSPEHQTILISKYSADGAKSISIRSFSDSEMPPPQHLAYSLGARSLIEKHAKILRTVGLDVLSTELIGKGSTRARKCESDCLQELPLRRCGSENTLKYFLSCLRFSVLKRPVFALQGLELFRDQSISLD